MTMVFTAGPGPASATGNVLTVLHPGTAGAAAVVVFPHAGGSPRFFRHWDELLPATTLVGVTYPGRDTRRSESYADGPYGDDLPGLAHSAADAIRSAGLAAPVLVGHSLGAYVAYEAAAALTRAGVPGVRLVVSGQNAPDQRPTTTLHRSADDDLVADMIRQNPESAQLWEHEELRAMFLPAVREDYRLLETYAPGTTLVPELLVCYGDRDDEVLAAAAGTWHRYARHAHPPAVFTGGHFYLQAPDEQLPRRLAASFGLG